ncbi:MAG: aminoglycoside phosphotransferase family protein [bacterium]
MDNSKVEIKAHNLVNLEGAALESAIKNDFGFEIGQLEKVVRGYSSQVYSGILDGRTVFIRINKDQRVFDVEVLGYEAFKKQGVPVPEIIAYQAKPSTIGQPTMIMSSAEGVVMVESKSSPEQKEILYNNLAKLLKKIHEVKLEGFGKLIVENETLRGEAPNWKGYWDTRRKHYEDGLGFILERGFATVAEIQKIKLVFDEISSLDIGQASLLHRDMHHAHFFVKGTDITGVIDLGALMAGDPRLDIAVSLVFQSKEEQEFFRNGYGDLARDSVVDKYLLIILVDKIRFRFKERASDDPKLLALFKETLSKV